MIRLRSAHARVEWSGNQEMGGVGTDRRAAAASSRSFFFFLLIDGHISVLVNWFRSLSSRTFRITVVR